MGGETLVLPQGWDGTVIVDFPGKALTSLKSRCGDVLGGVGGEEGGELGLVCKKLINK